MEISKDKVSASKFKRMVAISHAETNELKIATTEAAVLDMIAIKVMSTVCVNGETHLSQVHNALLSLPRGPNFAACRIIYDRGRRNEPAEV